METEQEQETKNILAFVDKGNYHAAINTAISSMNACRKESNQLGVDHFISVIKNIVDTMAEEFGS